MAFTFACLWDDRSVSLARRTLKRRLDHCVTYAQILVMETAWGCLGGQCVLVDFPTHATKQSLPCTFLLDTHTCLSSTLLEYTSANFCFLLR